MLTTLKRWKCGIRQWSHTKVTRWKRRRFRPKSSTRYSRISMKRSSRKPLPTCLTINSKCSILIFTTTESQKGVTLFMFWMLSLKLILFIWKQRNLSQLHVPNQHKWTWKYPRLREGKMKCWSREEKRQLWCSLRKRNILAENFRSTKKQQLRR